MLVLPIETEDHESDALLIVLDAASIARMKDAYPVDIPACIDGIDLVNPKILICWDDGPELVRLISSKASLVEVFAHLTRGWEPGGHEVVPRPFSSLN